MHLFNVLSNIAVKISYLIIAKTLIKCPIKYANIIKEIINTLDFAFQKESNILEIEDNSERMKDMSILFGGILVKSTKLTGKINIAKNIIPGRTRPRMSKRKLSIFENVSAIIRAFYITANELPMQATP